MYSAEENYLTSILVEGEIVTEAQVEDAKGQRKGTESIIETLIRTGHAKESDVARCCAVNYGMEYVDLTHVTPAKEIVDMVKLEDARRYAMVPIGFDQNRLEIAISDPFDTDTIDSLNHVLGYDVDPRVSSHEQINDAIGRWYDEAIGGADADTDMVVISESSGSDSGGGEAGANDAPVIKLVGQILKESFNAGASDIHIEPLEKSVRVRYRIDGVLHEVANHPRNLLSSIIARIKIMTGAMSIAEKRLPQDARIQLRLGDKDLDLRVSTIPTNHGESVVMRILDKSALNLGLAQLGFLSDDQATFEQLITLPDGILLVTGPTGSGKTTTLYACLNYINKPDRKIITVEDPVEYQMSGINQVMVKEDVGMTFAAALRSILRQAPNIIMIGEIRDLETASIAINASLTGHLVFSTLHTNDAPSAVARMADIGVKRFLIASAVRAIIAQRLIRKLCSECKTAGQLNEREIKALSLDAAQLNDSTIMTPDGCVKCRATGYKGRAGIFEIFEVDDEVRHMVNENLSTPQLRRQAREIGMRTLREDGIRKVLNGMTSASEVIHVTMSDAN
ncbi:MAG: ATPase, T2SS/T4P/T4SS family [Verrucomicrobiota bacterium]|nr:ATPase, T2SS/T4P/T4SS family [Verrucomicrobiota bacterium]MED6299447.1 ATPase, T2SS/T4P/T4SS family [Verrucomicrobiota bacterium]